MDHASAWIPGTAGEMSPPTPTPSDAPSRVRPETAQIMQGFGASGAWWPNDLVSFEPEVQEQVAELLFAPGPDGIALSVHRYNIGGGGVGVARPARAAQTFQVSPGKYDWDRDPGGRLFLRLAGRWQVPVLIGFVNSAPAVWTTNGRCCDGGLVPGAEAAFARYLADVVTHLHQAEGAALAYVSPMNEPDYTRGACDQEGMAVPPAQRASVVAALGRELAARESSAGVIADESSLVGAQFLPEAPQWLGVEGTPGWLAALAHHLYDFPGPAALAAARALGERYSLQVWATEVCCARTGGGGFGAQYDPTIGGGLVLANLVWEALAQENAAAFHWWVALSPELGADPVADPEAPSRVNDHGWNDGLLYYDPAYATNGNQQIYVTRRYHALGHFSRYVRPGARRHEVDGVADPLRVLAFSQDGRWTVVAINNAAAGTGPLRLAMELPAAGLTPVEAVETSDANGLEAVPPPALSDSLLQADLPAQSVTTLVLQEAG
jgi:O-glycosyl hydrolase